jgi:hypothetical protein
VLSIESSENSSSDEAGEGTCEQIASVEDG